METAFGNLLEEESWRSVIETNNLVSSVIEDNKLSASISEDDSSGTNSSNPWWEERYFNLDMDAEDERMMDIKKEKEERDNAWERVLKENQKEVYNKHQSQSISKKYKNRHASKRTNYRMMIEQNDTQKLKCENPIEIMKIKKNENENENENDNGRIPRKVFNNNKKNT